MDNTMVSFYNIILCLSNALDLIAPEVGNHHKQVAYLAFRLAESIKLPAEQQKEIFFSALLHDIGALSRKERLELIENEPFNVNNHAFKGAKLLNEFKALLNISKIVKFHHLPWGNGEGTAYMGEKVPMASHLIHLADRTCAKIKPSRNVISQVSNILSLINKDKGTIFEPDLVDSLFELGKKDYIWMDLVSDSPIDKIQNIGMFNTVVLDIDDIVDITSIFSKIIDFRSRFTVCHSAGVAVVAEKLAEHMNFSSLECKMMLIAGYLHDLGKIAIDDSILEKRGKLSKDEFNEIRMHTYYTYQLLDRIPEFNTIKIWASYHHEKLNGMGYPFSINAGDITLGSRIMAVADIFTAITEDRPYRKGMDDEQAVQVLDKMVADGSIDGKVVKVLTANIKSINELRLSAQQAAYIKYKNFLDTPW